MANGAVQDVRVIELGHFGAVPSACAVLADWGADVIKIENPRGGDPMRGLLAIEQVQASEVNPWFELWNRNTRSIALDVTKERSGEVLYRLVQDADVFATNYEASILEKIKTDYKTLRGLNPKLIYASVTGYGTVGPDRHRLGFDYVAFWARSGIMDRVPEPDAAPRPQRPGMGDTITGSIMAGAIAAALFAREKTGFGQKLDLNLYQVGVWVAGMDNVAALQFGQCAFRHDRRTANNPLFNYYQTKDSRWIYLAMVQSDIHWPMFCKAVGKPEWEKDPRFESHVKRMEGKEALVELISEVLASKTYVEWDNVFKQHGVIYGPVHTPLDVVNDPQAWENNFFAEVDHGSGSTVRLIRSPVNFSETPASIRSCAPELGQHTEEILLELGYTWEDIADFKREGVII